MIPCGNRLSVTDAKNNTTTYTYNNIGEVLTETQPDNTKTTWTYDYLGRIATRKDGMNHLTSYVYDSLGRLTNKNYSLNGYPAGPYTSSTLPTVAYTYDSAGNRTSMTDGTGTTTYQYDPNGNLTSVTDGYGKQVQYTYDQANRRTSLITSFGTVDYTYDIAGNLSSINDFMENEITLNRDSEGRINQIIYPRINNQNGMAQYTFNGLDQLTGIDFTVPDGNYNQAAYVYDLNGNCIQIEQSAKDGSTYYDRFTCDYNYQYDDLNRQIGQQTHNSLEGHGNCTYGYDEAGNRISFSYEGDLVVKSTGPMPRSSGTLNYDAANRLISRDYEEISTPHTETLEYDNNGNQGKITNEWVSPGGNTYDTEEIRQYDLENRLTRTLRTNAEGRTYQTDYFYNGDGQLSKTITEISINDFETSYYLNDGNSIIAELDGAGAVIDSYTRIPGNGNLISAYRQIDYKSSNINDRGTVYTCSDLMGNIMLIFAKDIDEVKPNCFDYFGFGGSSEGSLGRFGFTGAPSFNGLYKMGARYYNPEIGRFITRDTYRGDIYKPWTQNLYTYCNNNPVNYVDPTGHMSFNPGAGLNYVNENYIVPFFDPGDTALGAVKSTFKAVGVTFVWVGGKAYAINAGTAGAGTAVVAGEGATAKIAEEVEGASSAPQKVIGNYPEYVKMSNKLGTKPFSVPDNIWNKMTTTEQWTANKKFLDRAIAKGSEFNLATPIDKVRPGSYLQKEIEYLTSQGYKLDSTGTKLVK